MKPILMRHCEPRNESFKAWINSDPYVHNPWHFHPEFEFTYILRGKGTLFIGDSMESYAKDDLLVIGPNLPHELRSDIEEKPDNYSQSISIHFKYDFLNESFYDLPEMVQLNELLGLANRGIRLTDNQAKDLIRDNITKLPYMNGMKRVVKLLEILEIVSSSNSLNLLSSNSFTESIDPGQDHRINKIYEYVMKNFRRPISNADVAGLVNMTNTSFCRYFKKRTNKSFISYLNEIRVGYACKLLLEGKHTVAEVAFECGYEYVSYFNKIFKEIKGMTPSEYVDEYFVTNMTDSIK
ncbi:AraC family transcriptional regulator [Membranicola marinus]|uniref:AraC family transcriptional regulator n=1 Tax=Membranihabitans marinus TaxID=1227546 RepID=A0A953HY26_9BACT|nr:AraC family transcriptional regulator [Membranihabitans marinus]MBY5960246.1 AraC family transcriptional regulator [Membranihabitans marinus]